MGPLLPISNSIADWNARNFGRRSSAQKGASAAKWETLGSMADVDEELGNQRALLIPVKNSDQAVEVFVDELPDDANDIIDILRAEVAPLDVWLQFAVRPVRSSS
jgi:hypothetical protein